MRISPGGATDRIWSLPGILGNRSGPIAIETEEGATCQKKANHIFRNAEEDQNLTLSQI
jgi:hypothetical protein